LTQSIKNGKIFLRAENARLDREKQLVTSLANSLPGKEAHDGKKD
jgi:hypothetical protein